MPSPAAPARLIARRYMTRFRCLADQCEDTCCSGLGIYLLPEELAALEGAVRGEAQLTARLVRGLDQGAELPPGYAALLNRPGQACTFLGATKLCTLIERGASSGLPFICSTFPRRFVHLPDGTVEVGGSMSCPELARLCLLSEDGMEVVEAPPEVSERYPEGAALVDPAAAWFTLVREWGAARLADRRQPVGARLLALAELAERAPAELRRSPAAPDPARVRQAMAEASAEEAREARARRAAGDFGAGLRGVLTMLRSHPAKSERYQQLVVPALEAFHAEVLGALAALGPGSGPPADGAYWAEAAAAFLQRRERARAAVDGALDLYLERFCLNAWWTEPCSRAPTLRSYAFRLTARAALVRFLWLAHPAIHALAQDPGPLDGERRARLDAAAVEAVQVIARLFESGRGIFDVLEEHFSPQAFGGDPLEPAAQFARICG